MTDQHPAADTDPRHLPFRSAKAMRAALDRREISAVELLDLHLDRCDRLNPALNVVVATDRDGARAAAKAADAALARGEGRILTGVPMTIKDVFEVVGMPATCGISDLAGHMPEQDADAVASLREAGSVIWGKTNVPTGAVDHQSFNDIYGVSRNPWNLERTPGGSSGGAAAAVATGLTPLELGSDIGGSIRVPSHFCGVYGCKPSWGVVPGRGHIPPMPGSRGKTPLGVYGPIARSAVDLEWALDVVAGPDRFDRKAWSVKLPASRHERLEDFRVGLWLDAYPLDDGYRAAIEGFVADLRRIGARVEAAHPQVDPKRSHAIYLASLMALEGAGGADAAYQAQVQAGLDADDPDSYVAVVGRSMSQTVRELGKAEEGRHGLMAAWEDFVTGHDLLIAPIFPCVAFPHDPSGDGHMAQYSRSLTVSGRPIPYLGGLMWPGLVTAPELPATAIPTGRLVEGLPAGVQVIGPHLEDRTTLRFAQLVERELGGYLIPPMCV